MRMAIGKDVHPDTLYNWESLGKQKAKDIAKEEEEGGGRRGSRQPRIPSSNWSVVVTNHLTFVVFSVSSTNLRCI